MACKVVWTRRATDDLHAIFESLSEYSDTRAENVVEEIIRQVFTLEQFPRLGRVVPELNIEAIREIVVHQYRTVYCLNKHEEVEVLAIRHSSRPLSIV